MAWQDTPTPIFDDPDGTHYFLRAEEWPAPGRTPRFWIDAKLPQGLRPPAAAARYLLFADCDTGTIKTAMAIDYDGEGAELARSDWLASPHDFAETTTSDAAAAILAYFCKNRG